MFSRLLVDGVATEMSAHCHVDKGSRGKEGNQRLFKLLQFNTQYTHFRLPKKPSKKQQKKVPYGLELSVLVTSVY
jgi:hypothetical protein